MGYYRECPYCGDKLDAGEICVCVQLIHHFRNGLPDTKNMEEKEDARKTEGE